MEHQRSGSDAKHGWVSVLPEHLMWAPELSVPSVEGDRHVSALDLCRHAGGKSSEYAIAHYTKASCGKAFGPLGMDTLLHFCRGLDAIIQESKDRVVLTTPKGDRSCRLNVLVMLGAYLIAKCSWTMDQIVGTLGKDTKSKFVCSWSQVQTPEADRVMSVCDCLDGIALAVKYLWLSPACMGDDGLLEAAVKRHRIRSIVFDATWVVPGLLMVASDPTTVVYDPNPATCKAMFPKTDGSTAVCDVKRPEAELDFTGRPTELSVDTVCKEYGENYEDMLPTEADDIPQDYVSFMKQSGVGIVIRINYDDEPGMPCKSYAIDAFSSYEIAQADIRFPDVKGGLPTPGDVAKMIQVCDGYADASCTGGAALIHCKGGFGRSIVMASCLAIYRYNVPGSAILGWVRVARPGAVTTRKQEVFLKSLKGSKEVSKYAMLSAENTNAVGVSCNGCSLQ